jgi:DHA2 family multidrug resistance protein
MNALSPAAPLRKAQPPAPTGGSAGDERGPAAATGAAGPDAGPLEAAEPHVPLGRWIGFMIMVVGMFMAILDIQIVSSSIAEIQAGLSASADEASWIQTSYLIAEVVMIPLSGYLSRLLSTRILFTVSAAGFTLASALCALAWDLDSMIVFRAFQGFIGGAMIPTVFATAYGAFPKSRGAMLTVLVGLVATLAPTLGPTLGGLITETFSWHWLFLLNLLPGMIVTLGVWALIDFDKPDWSLLQGFDGWGLLLMALFLGSLEYVLEEGPRQDWLEDEWVSRLAIVSAVAGVLFFLRMFTYARAIVDLRAFADRNFALGSLYGFILGILLYGGTYLLPLFLARVRDFNALQIGLVMIVTGAAQFATAPVAGSLSRKIDPRLMVAIGFGGLALSTWTNSFLTTESGFWELFLPQVLRGSSLMCGMIGANLLALGTLAPQQLKNASALYNLMRNLGGALGLAALNTLLIDRAVLHASRLADWVSWSRPWVPSFLAGLSDRIASRLPGSDSDLAALKLMQQIAARQATVLTFNDCLFVLMLLCLGGLALVPLMHKPRQATAEAH